MKLPKYNIFYSPMTVSADFIFCNKEARYLSKTTSNGIESVAIYDKAENTDVMQTELLQWYKNTVDELILEDIPGTPNFMIRFDDADDELQEHQFIFSGKQNKHCILLTKPISINDIIAEATNPNGVTLFYASIDTGLPEFWDISLFENINTPKEKIAAVLKDAKKWFKSYLLHEEHKIVEGITEPLIKDFSDILKLKIIYTEGKGWLAIYRAKVMFFETEPEMDNWLINKMNISESKLEQGYINIIDKKTFLGLK